MHLHKTSNLEVAGSSPAGRASFSAIFANLRRSSKRDVRGTERKRAAQSVTLAAHFESHCLAAPA